MIVRSTGGVCTKIKRLRALVRFSEVEMMVTREHRGQR
jgi:hypothetical protein